MEFKYPFLIVTNYQELIPPYHYFCCYLTIANNVFYTDPFLVVHN